MDIENLRREYVKDGLTREALADDPFEQFSRWFEQASKAEVLEPNAMSLATADADGRVTARTVLLKYFGRDGFVFFTNYHSSKAGQIASNPRVCLLFPWLALERQAIVEGRAEKASRRETLAYFFKRPRGSQLGAWVSHQSSVVGSRQMLESRFEELKRKFAGGEVPVPSFWGGYRVVPTRFEFWQGRPSRLHDRFQYTPHEGGWRIERLAP